MKTLPSWHYDECRHVGTDYADPAEAEGYDARHQQFRGDLTAEANRLLGTLAIEPWHTLLDIGCGTGNFVIQAAQRCATVYAVDISAPMLEVARRKADAAGVTNIVFCQGGFLTYEHAAAPVDRVTSAIALHHLPDFWKLVGLRRITEMLADDGLFYLTDLIYSFDPQEYADAFESSVTWFANAMNDAFAEEVATHYRDEYSTFAWIMEGLLTRAGFTIEQAQYPNEMWAQYWCRKNTQKNRRCDEQRRSNP